MAENSKLFGQHREKQQLMPTEPAKAVVGDIGSVITGDRNDLVAHALHIHEITLIGGPHEPGSSSAFGKINTPVRAQEDFPLVHRQGAYLSHPGATASSEPSHPLVVGELDCVHQ